MTLFGSFDIRGIRRGDDNFITGGNKRRNRGADTVIQDCRFVGRGYRLTFNDRFGFGYFANNLLRQINADRLAVNKTD